jgi:hypothetical protein
MLRLGRVEDLWFPDADLILRAENTLFRVHSGILCARCSVFRDMVTFPQPDNPESDTIDGNPVVRLHDLADEVEVFLRAVFDSRCVKYGISQFDHAPNLRNFFMPQLTSTSSSG